MRTLIFDREKGRMRIAKALPPEYWGKALCAVLRKQGNGWRADSELIEVILTSSSGKSAGGWTEARLTFENVNYPSDEIENVKAELAYDKIEEWRASGTACGFLAPDGEVCLAVIDLT